MMWLVTSGSHLPHLIVNWCRGRRCGGLVAVFIDIQSTPQLWLWSEEEFGDPALATMLSKWPNLKAWRIIECIPSERNVFLGSCCEGWQLQPHRKAFFSFLVPYPEPWRTVRNGISLMFSLLIIWRNLTQSTAAAVSHSEYDGPTGALKYIIWHTKPTPPVQSWLRLESQIMWWGLFSARWEVQWQNFRMWAMVIKSLIWWTWIKWRVMSCCLKRRPLDQTSEYFSCHVCVTWSSCVVFRTFISLILDLIEPQFIYA